MPSIVILLATYNSAAHLSALVDSILASDDPDFRLLIRDDCSTDSTPVLVDSYQRRDQRISVTLSDVQSGGAQNNFFRLLLDAPDADYLMFADADDVWLPDKISRTLDRMRACEAACGCSTPVLVHGDLTVVDAQLQVLAPSLFAYEKLSPQRKSLKNLLCQNNVTGCTVMINRALRQLVPAQPAHSVMHDWWLALIAAAFGHIEVINEPLLLYRQHGNNQVGAYNAHDPLLAAKKLSRTRHIHAVYNAMFAQAGCFAETFADRLSPSQLRICRAYAAMATQGKPGRIFSIIRYGFYKNTWVRNLGQLIAI